MVLISVWNYLLMVLFCLKIGIPKCLQSCIDSQSWLCQKIIFIFSLKIFFIPFLSQMISFYWGLVLRALNFEVLVPLPKNTDFISATVKFHNLAYMKDTTLSICSTYVQAKSHEMPCMLDIHAKDNEYPQISFRYFSVHYHLKPKISFLLLIHILR